MHVMFVEPPKDYWFVMGEYISPPLGMLALASYLESQNKEVEINIVDCQAEEIGWNNLHTCIGSYHPDAVAISGLGTCNAYAAIRTAQIAKNVDPNVITVLGGQHFSALPDESLHLYPSIDIIVRGEGEETLSQLISHIDRQKSLLEVKGLSFRHNRQIFHNSNRAFIDNLNSLPLPGYHFVEKNMKKYYFTLMAGKNTPFAIVEGSRGCRHNCSYCSQWRLWGRTQRMKSPKRIVDEMEKLYSDYGTRFFWLADDNFVLGERVNRLCDEIIGRRLDNNITWFCQVRCDNIVLHRRLLPKMRKAGNIWILTGLDHPVPDIMKTYRRKGINRSNAKAAIELLRNNDIFSQGMFIIGDRKDSHKSIEQLQEFADWLDPDIATFMTLTPFPGTEIYENAKRNGWIEESNWNNYDMIHAIIPTENLTREEVQEELYECYRRFYGNWKRRYQGLFSNNIVTRRTYQYLARKAIVTGLKNLF